MKEQIFYNRIFFIFLFFQFVLPTTLNNAYASSSEEIKTVNFFDYEAQFVPLSVEISPFFDSQQEKWKEIKEKYHPSLYVPQTTAMSIKNAQKWMALNNYLKNADDMEILRGINDFMNKAPSRDDKELYKEDEYWASPEEFFKNWGGDCEDYAFAKYFALVYLNWSLDDLWILLFYHKEEKGFHAVLLVTIDEKVYILDNLVNPSYKIYTESEYKDVVLPLSVLSYDGLWLFPKGVKQYKDYIEIESKNNSLESLDPLQK